MPDLRTHGLLPLLAETAICLLDSSLRIQSSLKRACCGKQLFSRRISPGSNFFCQAALAPSYLQIGLTAGIPHPHDGLSFHSLIWGSMCAVAPFISLLMLGKGLLSPALIPTTVRAAWRNVSAWQGQMAQATDCRAVANFQ